ncbi:MAG: hypothetical protein HC924_15935, partial [Synechococcaceae cyanobacterium SM2_3_2]|nr:hypothetical protein [Synechococcaceae cyanobacterium SM2_3_2]
NAETTSDFSFQSLFQESLFQAVPRNYAGIGVATLVLFVVGTKLIWRKSSAKSAPNLNRMKGDLKQLRAALVTTIASQKDLERQHTEVQHKVAEWAQRADQATHAEDPGLLEQALAEKRVYDLRSAELNRSLREVNIQVSALRDSIGQLEGQIKVGQHRAGIVA